jgi:ABC-type antimicrobial peptide transport system permease subunit
MAGAPVGNLGTVFSIISMLMAVVGLYGLLAFDISQRTREFGIRSAVGAQKLDVALLLLRDLARIVIPGVLAGTVVCFLLAQLVAFALYGVRPLDPAVLLGAISVTMLIASTAAWSPVRRATRVDPAIVLRDE